MNLDLDNVEGAGRRLQRRRCSAEGAGRHRRRRAAERCSCDAKQRDRVTVPLNASGAGAATVKVAIKGPGDFALERSYALNVKPATQVLARRTVKPIAKGESLTLSNDLFADLVPGTGSVSRLGRRLDRARRGGAAQGARPLSVRLLRADHQPGDAAALRQRARERRASGARRRHRPAHPRRHRPRAGAPGVERLVRPLGRRRRRRLARRLRHRLPDARARARLRGAGHGVQAGARPAAQHRRHRAGRRPRTAAAISPMRSMCWRATARRRSAICAISPTPSSTISARRSPRRRSPRRSACSATAPAPSASTRPRSTISSRRRRPELFSREDYGSTLRDAAALVTLASEAGGSRPTIVNAVRADRAGEGARALHLDAGERLAGAGRARDGEGRRRRVARRRGRQRQGRALPQRQGERARRSR